MQATNEYLLDQVISIKTKSFFQNTNGRLKTGKMGTHLSADASPAFGVNTLVTRDQKQSKTLVNRTTLKLIDKRQMEMKIITKPQI